MDYRWIMFIVAVLMGAAAFRPTRRGVERVGDELTTAEAQAKAARAADKRSRDAERRQQSRQRTQQSAGGGGFAPPMKQRTQRMPAAPQQTRAAQPPRPARRTIQQAAAPEPYVQGSWQAAPPPASRRASARQVQHTARKYERQTRRYEKLPPLFDDAGGRLCMQDKCSGYAYGADVFCVGHGDEQTKYTAWRTFEAAREWDGWQKDIQMAQWQPQPVETDPFEEYGWQTRMNGRNAPTTPPHSQWEHSEDWERTNNIGATDYAEAGEIGDYFDD